VTRSTSTSTPSDVTLLETVREPYAQVVAVEGSAD
jgi:hypothetical protein